MDLEIIEEVWQVIQDRKANPKKDSYTNRLLNDESLVFKKLEEELGELEQSAKSGCCGGGKDSIEWETADILYHLLVLLASKGVELEDVLAELRRRRS
jgi:phosphoribosyl-ATP pyrophosphohydrolase